MSGKLVPKFKKRPARRLNGALPDYPQDNPEFDYYLSFNIGYPNSYDRS